MENIILLNHNDVKKIIAKYLGIDEKQIIKSQYSYSVKCLPEEAKIKLAELDPKE